MKRYEITDVRELEQIARDMIEMLKETAPENEAAILALHGDLGAGKTTFMQTLARELGVAETVVSPTFVVMKKYETTNDTFKTLVHIDAYRIDDIDEMRPLRFGEELRQKDTIIGIEWAERIELLLPLHTIHMHFELVGEKRTISVHGQEGI